MDHIPAFKLNDKVRIMQTDEMVKRGIDNIVGRINGFNIDGSANVLTIVDTPKLIQYIPLHSMSHTNDVR